MKKVSKRLHSQHGFQAKVNIFKNLKSLFEYHKMNEAIVTSNCTTALHLALKSLNIGIDDEVLCQI